MPPVLEHRAAWLVHLRRPTLQVHLRLPTTPMYGSDSVVPYGFTHCLPSASFPRRLQLFCRQGVAVAMERARPLDRQ